jgi:hypothetical protein
VPGTALAYVTEYVSNVSVSAQSCVACAAVSPASLTEMRQIWSEKPDGLPRDERDGHRGGAGRRDEEDLAQPQRGASPA